MSDTGTIELSRVRDAASAATRDSASQDKGSQDTGRDPAERAHRIVEEVLAAHAEELAEQAQQADATAGAADREDRVIDVTDAAALDAGAGPARRARPDDAPGYDRDAAAIVMLAGEEPLVLLPGATFDPTREVWTPPQGESRDDERASRKRRRRTADRDGGRADARDDDTLTLLVGRALGEDEAPADRPVPADAARDAAADGDVDELDEVDGQPDSIRATLTSAAHSPHAGMPRWVLAGLVWIVAAALLVPLAVKALGTSIHLELDLWGDNATAQQPTSQPVDQPASQNADQPAVPAP